MPHQVEQSDGGKGLQVVNLLAKLHIVGADVIRRVLVVDDGNRLLLGFVSFGLILGCTLTFIFRNIAILASWFLDLC